MHAIPTEAIPSGPNHFISLEGKYSSRHTQQDFLHLAGTLLEHFLEGMALLRNVRQFNPKEKSSKKYKLFLPS